VSYQYGYDGAAQLLSAVASISGTQSPIDAYAYLYDAAGNRTSQQINNSVMSSAYNTLNQVTSESGGRMLTISGSLSQPGTVVVGGGQPYVTGTSSYNFSAQVPVVAGSNSIQISATNVNSIGVTKTLTLTATNGTAVPHLTYDLNGNLTYDGTYNYAWDSANRLVAIWYGAVGTSGSTTMAYDGLGRRVQIVESSSNGTVNSTKNLVWDGMTICEEKNASDAVTKAYFREGVQMNGVDYYYTRDHLGSVREVTGTNGVVLAEYSYDPYGLQTETSGTMTFDIGFTGQYYHQPSGLLLAPYRGYSATLGRWISRDPLANAEMRQGPNLYAYVLNDPICRVDPLGLWTFSLGFSFSGGAAVGGNLTFGAIFDSNGNFGLFGTVGGGVNIGTPEAGAGVYAGISNAPDLDSYKKCSGDVSGHGGAGWGASAEYSTWGNGGGPNGDQPYHEVGFTGGVQAGASEFTGASYTGVYQF